MTKYKNQINDINAGKLNKHRLIKCCLREIKAWQEIGAITNRSIKIRDKQNPNNKAMKLISNHQDKVKVIISFPPKFST